MVDPRHAALQRLAQSRQRLGLAFAPSAPGSFGTPAVWRRLRRLGQGLLKGSGWRQTGQLAGERLRPWAQRHPGWVLGLGVVAGAGLFWARGGLMAAARLQALRWWQTGQALLLQQSLDPVWLQQLLSALPVGTGPADREPLAESKPQPVSPGAQAQAPAPLPEALG